MSSVCPHSCVCGDFSIYSQHLQCCLIFSQQGALKLKGVVNPQPSMRTPTKHGFATLSTDCGIIISYQVKQ